MDAKHQFKYTYNETDLEEFSPVEVTFEMPAEISLTQMLYNFERYLQACGFVFDGHLDFVENESSWDKDIIDDSEEYFNGDSFPQSMADTGASSDVSINGCCGLKVTSSSLENEKLKEWNEGIAKLSAEVAKNKWVHGICNPKAK